MENIKHYYLSANTRFGFFNNFKFLNSTKETSFTYILKGGPGTGKSTLLKTVGNHFIDKDFQVEFFHCSSDPSSLDGIRLVDYNISIIDGTAPHSMDTNLPLIDSEIINLGDFIDGNIKTNSLSIKKLANKKSICYLNGYKCLKVAGDLFEFELNQPSSQKQIKKQAQKILKDLELVYTKKKGENRNLFVSLANDSNNFIKHNNYQRINNVALPLYECSSVLKEVERFVTQRGYDTISLFSSLDPNLQIGLVIPRRNLLFVQKNILSGNQTTLLKNKETVDSVLRDAFNFFEKAKKYHKKIETFYVKNMDFKKLEALTKKLILKIENQIIYYK